VLNTTVFTNKSLQGINKIWYFIFSTTPNICKENNNWTEQNLWCWYSIRQSGNTPHFMGKRFLC